MAESLAQASPGAWRGVAVNCPCRAGWLNIYMVGASRRHSDGLLEEEGVNFTAEALEGGARAHEATNAIFLNTAAWKRVAAATAMKQTGA